jgi:type I restriction enzyme S subunit
MEVKPGYKPTDVGIIPQDWEVSFVGTMGDVRGGKALAAKGMGQQRPYLRTKNVFDGRIDLADVLQMPMTEAEFSRHRLRHGDVLLNEGQSLELVGRCAMYKDEYPEPCGIQNQLIRFRARNGVSPSFAAHLFRYCQKSGVFATIALQTTSVAHLGVSRFHRLQLAWPPKLTEQECIAEALSDADALIKSLEQLIAKKRRLKQGAMQQLLSGERRLPGFGVEWKFKSLGDLFDFSGGFTASRKQLSTEGHCYLHYGDIHLSKKTYIDVRAEHQGIPKLDIPLKSVSPASLLDDGDVVFVDASEDDEGTSKHLVVINKDSTPFISGLHTIVAKPKSDELDQQYQRYCFQTIEIKRQFRFFSVGTKVSGISKTNIARVTLPVPEPCEQTAIAAILSDMDAEITALEGKLAKACQLKQGMMQELLTGKVRLV